MSRAARAAVVQHADEAEVITVTIAGQHFGIPVLSVQDVLSPHRIMPIPLAPAGVAGALNLRGRIVTAIDVAVRLGRPAAEDPGAKMSVVVEVEGELYSLLVDEVGDVMRLSSDQQETSPPTLDPVWRELSQAVFRLDGRILLQLDVRRLIAQVEQSARG